MLETHCQADTRRLRSSWSRVFTNQIGLVSVHATKPNSKENDRVIWNIVEYESGTFYHETFDNMCFTYATQQQKKITESMWELQRIFIQQSAQQCRSNISLLTKSIHAQDPWTHAWTWMETRPRCVHVDTQGKGGELRVLFIFFLKIWPLTTVCVCVGRRARTHALSRTEAGDASAFSGPAFILPPRRRLDR